MLTLSKAIKDGRLQDFVTQDEARGVGPIDLAKFEETATKLIKTERSDDQTSGSPRHDGSHEK